MNMKIYNLKMEYIKCVGKYVLYSTLGSCIGTISLPTIIAIVPFALGFTIGGIVTGSIGAMCMAFHAGYVPIDGFVATMQRIGTMGVHAGFNKYVISIGALCGCIVGIKIGINHIICTF
jgi:hypothetical protein